MTLYIMIDLYLGSNTINGIALAKSFYRETGVGTEELFTDSVRQKITQDVSIYCTVLSNISQIAYDICFKMAERFRKDFNQRPRKGELAPAVLKVALAVVPETIITHDPIVRVISEHDEWISPGGCETTVLFVIPNFDLQKYELVKKLEK